MISTKTVSSHRVVPYHMKHDAPATSIIFFTSHETRLLLSGSILKHRCTNPKQQCYLSALDHKTKHAFQDERYKRK